MKKVLLIITALIYLSCSYNYDKDIKKIEKILEIDLNQYDYEVKDVEYSFGFGEELVIFNIIFNINQDFETFLNEIDLNKFNFNPLWIYEYSLTVNFKNFTISLIIDKDENKLKYTYKE